MKPAVPRAIAAVLLGLAAQGARMRLPSSEVCRQSQALGDEFLTDSAPLGELEFAALERVIERKDPSYKN